MSDRPLEQPESEEDKAKRMAVIGAFCDVIKTKRTDAIAARKASGIEEVWQEDEDAYEGIDDANRKTAKMQKGRNTSDGLTESKDTKTRSTVFLKITRPYVDAAAARVSDMLLPTDDRNFAVEHTPRPELTKLLEQAKAQPAPAQPPQAPGLMQRIGSMFKPAQPAPEAPVVDQAAMEAKAAIDAAKASAERAQEEIDDWLTECQYHAEVRKQIEGAAKVGTGILKGPHPEIRRARAAKKVRDATGQEVWTVEMVEKIAPTSKWVNHWNFYPCGDCGDDIQKGSGVFECDEITARTLLDLKGSPGYLADAIDLCIEDGPVDPVDGTKRRKEGDKPKDSELFQIWYFHGQVSKKDMEACGVRCGDKDNYPAVVTMVNDRVIKVAISQLDSGEYPYDVMVWQARTDHWAGVGVARQMRECQKGANAAVRNLMDNAGLSAGPQIIIDRSKIIPANGRWELTPRKIWYTVDGEEGVDVTKAFMIVNINTLQSELMAILQLWVSKAEEVTGLPMLLQGQLGQAGATDKVGIANIMNNNGSTVLRRLARTFDDRVTVRHIGRYYEWLLLYGPDEAKGDFQIKARGSSALVERDLQSQALPQLIGLSLNPAYGLDPELVIKEVLKSLRLNTQTLELTDEKKQEIASRQPPEDPRVTVAKMQIEADQAEGNAERMLEQEQTRIDAQLKGVEIASEERMALEKQKVLLASLVLQLRERRDQDMARHTIDVFKHRNPQAKPPTEPVGRAPAGHSFEQ